MSSPSSEAMQENKSMNSVEREEEGVVLPRDIWREIGKRLECRLDVSQFRSVSRTWRSALPSPSRFPLRVPAPPGPKVKYEHGSCFITEVTFYAINQMIVVFEEEYQGGKFSASAMVLRSQLQQYDSKFELPPPVSQISNHLSFLSNAYHIHNAIPLELESESGEKYKFIANQDVLKIAIISDSDSHSHSHSHSGGMNPNYGRECDLSVVAHLCDRKLGVLRLGGGAMNNQWETGFCDTCFEDIINYNCCLYAVDSKGRTFVMDYKSLRMTQVGTGLPLTPPRLPLIWKQLHLAVAAPGDLYLIVHYPALVYNSPTKLYKLISRSSSQSRLRHLKRWWGQDFPCVAHCWVVNVCCNFPVARDLLKDKDKDKDNDNDTDNGVRAWPEFAFVRLAVGFANTYEPPFRARLCDVPFLPFFVGESPFAQLITESVMPRTLPRVLSFDPKDNLTFDDLNS